MRADSVGAPVTPQQWDYIHEMGGALRSSLDNVTAVFAPSCIGHAVLTKRDWLNIKIDDISLVDALRCWERSTRKHKGKGKGLGLRNADGGQKNRRERIQLTNSDGFNRNESSTIAATVDTAVHRQRHRLTKEERMRRKQNMTDEERERRRLNRMRKNQRQNGRNMNENVRDSDRRNSLDKKSNRLQDKSKLNNTRQLGNGKMPPNGKQNQNNNRKRRRNRNNENNGRNAAHRKKFVEPKRCSLRLLERCSWPQCNHSCPALTNPLTGEEMRFLELLSSFGLDIEAVATALGIDMQTLNNMDHAELVNLLTQQVS